MELLLQQVQFCSLLHARSQLSAQKIETLPKVSLLGLALTVEFPQLLVQLYQAGLQC